MMGASTLESLEAPDLVAEFAHTLRSRLTSILFLAETLYDATPPDEHATRRQLGLLYGSALGATVFTSNLMELVRGGHDLVGLEPEPLSIPALLRRIRDEIAPIIEQRGLGLALRIRPPTGPDRLGHSMALHRVMLALMMVALEFTDEGAIELAGTGLGPALFELSIHAPAAVVADPLETLEHSVEPRDGGTGWAWSPVGVALTTARQICQKMGAELEIGDDADGRGLHLRVVLRLPTV
jgi:K+-sensing histidine kinase KdpD